MFNLLRSNTRALGNDRRGVTIIEYALIVALIGVALIPSLTTLRSNISTEFAHIGNSL